MVYKSITGAKKLTGIGFAISFYDRTEEYQIQPAGVRLIGTTDGSSQNMQLASGTACRRMLSMLKRYMNSRGNRKTSQKNYKSY